MDINIIKKFIENDLPSDKESLVSYYKQLKQILIVLSDNQQQQQASQQQQSNQTNNNNHLVIGSIEEKMKSIEQNFNDILNLSENTNNANNNGSPVFVSLDTINQQQQQHHHQQQHQHVDIVENNNKKVTTEILITENNNTQQQQQQQQQAQVQAQPVVLNEQQQQQQSQASIQQALANMGEKKRSSRHSGPPEIPPEEIKFDVRTDLLGGGAYGKVYKATCRGKKVAVKVPKKQHLSESELKSFKNEVEIMKQIFHPNVVLFLGACTKPGKVMIVSELMQTDLEKLIHSPDVAPPPLYQRMKMCLDAALGINWLHGICNIIHRDLKLANLMISKDKTVKIGDFGFSQVIKTGTTAIDQKGPKGTALYMAPEVMMKQEFNEKADVYSFGLILYEMATCEELFPEYSEIDPFYDAICNKRLRPPIPDGFPRSLKALITKCWDHDPNKRPSFNEVTQKMNEVLTDTAISGVDAAMFWKYNFIKPESESVPWNEFALKLSTVVNVPIQQLGPLSQLFVSQSFDEEVGGVVSMERFDLMNKWFGNFFNSRVGPYILNEMNELLKKRWFHFDISRDISEKRLRGRPENTFLIRLSANDPVKTPFTISKTKGSKPTHKRVTRVDASPNELLDFPMGYKFIVPLDGNDLVFNSITQMVDSLMKIQNLVLACPVAEIKVPYLTD